MKLLIFCFCPPIRVPEALKMAEQRLGSNVTVTVIPDGRRIIPINDRKTGSEGAKIIPRRRKEL